MTIARARELFARAFGGRPAALWSAPGRVNLIGEHVDYAGGDVLPIAIDRRTVVGAAPARHGRIRAVSARRRGQAIYDLARPVRRGDWGDYIAGAAVALAEEGVAIEGADVVVAGEVPRGAGLSSSAALDVAAVAALAAAAGAELPPDRLAALAHRAESGFVGVPCGIMDQWAAALCRAGHALHLRCADRAVEQVPFGQGVLIVDSMEPRALRRSRYAERRRECDEALRRLRRVDAALPSLADAGDALLATAALPEPLAGRARHVASETRRVRALSAALLRGDPLPGALLFESHASLRDDFECSTPTLDWIVEQARTLPGVTGARLTGAGWGGCAILVGNDAALHAAAPELASRFTRCWRRQPRWWITTASDGARSELDAGG